MSKCETERTKRITVIWSDHKLRKPFVSRERYNNIASKWGKASSLSIKQSESFQYQKKPYLYAIRLRKNASDVEKDITIYHHNKSNSVQCNNNSNFSNSLNSHMSLNSNSTLRSNRESIQAMFNNKYYANDVKTKLYVLPNNVVIKNRYLQKSLIGDDLRYYHMRKMVRFWDCFCNYVCPKITISKFLASQRGSVALKNTCQYYHSPSNQIKTKQITKLPVLYTNSSSGKPGQKKEKRKIKIVKKVYSSLDINRVPMDNELQYFINNFKVDKGKE